ncbi:MAG: TRAP transporter small permease subunit [Xanthobacteraceae bacterium]|nr:TRAP transporter small permease subunit [Xanthobacteraceae bacterium]MBX3523986.1 TRAP transporter small permease subunit [Xanthobacteraceae bacterium]MBX3535190.1 TRAP transporter small permease subunit [Xanthobacteraceae bacterium]MBX3550277.1 TRAP transporter small permease subunit [Xanthobacteraceae bacterium]MCW5674187.1 TRAP transporter small permease subunit [Xanthobacteraceae bacterium]
MRALLAISRAIDYVNIRLGKAVAWLIVVAITVSTVNAIIRKLLNQSSNAWLELQWYLFAAVFMFCAAWTLISNEHIRIDIVNNQFSKRVRNWIDLIGHVFALLPFCIVMIWTSIPFFLTSYNLGERSFAAGGLPQWIAKLIVPVAFVILLIQSFSEIIKRVAIMRGAIPDPYDAPQVHAAEAEAERLLQAANTKS